MNDFNLLISDRRKFFGQITGAAVGGLAATRILCAGEKTGPDQKTGNRGRIYKSVKWGMIEEGDSIRERFQICKELGFDGMELESPWKGDVEEVLESVKESGLPVHGTVGQKHWSVRLSSPKEEVRQEARQDLVRALNETKAFGGDSVLLVPGSVQGDRETHDDVWKRSIQGIRTVVPHASRLGVRILIENVWNGFCETPELLRDYIDEINSPWVGVYFDIGNVQKFSPSQDWIHVLGNRIVKLDVKDWGESNGFCKIGDGDVDWPAVRDALDKIAFTGWCTAEVSGGNRERLQDIAARMDRVLEL